MNRVVVGIDGTASSHDALAWAAEEATRRDAQLVVVHAWKVPVAASGPGWPLLTDTAPFAAAAQATVRRALEAFDTSGLPRGVATRLVEGDAATALLKEASNAELLVVGSSRRSWLGELLFGSVGREVRRHASVPAVVVPPRRGTALRTAPIRSSEKVLSQAP
jgi:nucleotide-binding universal stress UspA family protein